MTWPFENDTSAITKKLAKNSLKSGKMRNLLIILTISLSIALMSGLALYIAPCKPQIVGNWKICSKYFFTTLQNSNVIRFGWTAAFRK